MARFHSTYPIGPAASPSQAVPTYIVHSHICMTALAHGVETVWFLPSNVHEVDIHSLYKQPNVHKHVMMVHYLYSTKLGG